MTFTATAIGTPDPAYQWRSNSVNISGATSSSYAITGVQTNHAANYTVVASNTSGSVTSAVAVLTVPEPSALALLIMGFGIIGLRCGKRKT